MSKTVINNVKLGIFVLSGILFLILTLFMIGKNRSFFGSNYKLRAQFKNIYGLTEGNNVRYSGIQVGTVKEIKIINDTLIEVSFTIKSEMKKFIHIDDFVTIGGEGLMGNKVINIEPASSGGRLAKESDLLKTKTSINTDEMLKMLEKTNQDINAISSGLKQTVNNINNSSALWGLLNDQSIPVSIRKSLENILTTTSNIQKSSSDLDKILVAVNNGKGTLGMLLKDSTMAVQLNSASIQVNQTAKNANQVTQDLQKLLSDINREVQSGKGPVNGLLKDEEMTKNISKSLANIESGTQAFSQNMEALKHNFFFKGYFKKQEKIKLKSAKEAESRK